MASISLKTLDICKSKLTQLKADILNRRRLNALEFYALESGGDEADQSSRAIEEIRSVEMNQRLREHLLEIEFALSRIIDGTFGLCEETGETIEEERLMAIPWTRLSIEGAEIREKMLKKFAR